jgi:hypothetical protein
MYQGSISLQIRTSSINLNVRRNRYTQHGRRDIGREVFEGYWAGFEDPVGERGIVVKVK